MEIPADAKAAADRGDLIEAIKITRQATSVGLKEAKEAVEAYRGGAPIANGPDGVQIPLQAISALHQGSLIDAIKRTREATGLGLKDAKEAVEAYLAAHPTTDQQFRAAGGGRNGPPLVMVAGLILIAAAVYWWLSGA
ncbi:MAG: ribosomal protein L7/L12 [Vicinamibacterales bacterium]